MKPSILILFLSCCIRSGLAQPCITVAETCNEESCGFDYCGPYVLSRGVYRLPFVDGTEIEVVCDHLSHCPRGRVDMVGTDGDINGEYHICAAADGWIRAIVDDHHVQCDCSVSSCENNYVWMEHPNGEWTKYTHMKLHSVTNLGHFEGEYVTAGTYLGDEGDVGCASGFHLHFEVAQPIDTNTLVFSESGGYIDADFAQNRIPVFCGITGNVLVKGETYDAEDCPSACGGFLVPFPVTYQAGDYEVVLNDDEISNSADLTFDAYSSALFQAAGSIMLNPGFEVVANATFIARIGDCDEMNLKASGETTTQQGETGEGLFDLYPNPSDGRMMLEFKMPVANETQIVIRNALGMIVQSILTGGNGKLSIDLTSQPSGIYFVECASGNTIYFRKILVAR